MITVYAHANRIVTKVRDNCLGIPALFSRAMINSSKNLDLKPQKSPYEGIL
ncbi:hypothetical protein SAMN06295967_10822 [Belliella buryatensis]|uniref:Uncharacterized protein n=1 Tax=Belliella buryatensis TaxID=1500549 RepID=A0A239DT62_9BACT|nr:hypothetical protein SAMN06295967_10822 [Belliella buryatensis]